MSLRSFLKSWSPEICIIFKHKLRSESIIPWCYVDYLYTKYTWLSHETASQAKEILWDFAGYYWAISCQNFYVKCLQTYKLKTFCTLSITLIRLQEIVLCIKPWNNSTLWALPDVSWLIWNSQVPELYLGRSILINSNAGGFFPFPSAIWNGKLLTYVIKTQRWIWTIILPLLVMRHRVLTINFDQTNTLTFKWQS